MNHEEKAKQNLKGFVRITDELFLKDKVKFDLILASGDSGYSLKYIFDRILGKRRVKSLPSLVLPYYRYAQKYVASGTPFDNKDLIRDVERVVKDFEALNNILFIDDEIGEKGRTISGLVDLISKAKPSLLDQASQLYIVAEDHGFCLGSIKGVKTIFKPFSKKEDKINNAISYLVPESIRTEVKNKYGELYPKELFNSLLNLPIKKLRDDIPYWSYELLDDLKKKVANFDLLQKEFQDYLDRMISES